MRGRPPGWNCFARLDGSAWLEAIDIDDKGRVTISVEARKRLDWINKTKGALIADIANDNCAELLAWSPHGEDRVQKIQTAIAGRSDQERSEIVLSAMDRFLQLSLDGAGRVSLPANLRRHIDTDEQRKLWVVTRENRLWLWNDETWRAGRKLRSVMAVEG
jgi:DNA-binding transcriptional regulator/RsmH inhibitor MraZ